jgi:uncharacterized membrane protein YbhN (UPF0104 family)
VSTVAGSGRAATSACAEAAGVPAMPAGAGAAMPPGARRRALLRNLLAVTVAVAVIVLLVRHRTTLDAGTDSVAGADPIWLLLAAAGTLLLWTAGTVSQLGSVAARLPVRRLFAVQVAATFANHVLPSGSGGMAVNVRFLQRCGLSRGAAVGAVALNLAAGTVTHVVVLLAALLLAPSSLAAALAHGGRPGGLPAGSWPLIAVAVLVPAAVLLWVFRAAVARFARGLAGHLAILSTVLRTPRRAVQLWSGSIAVPVLHCLVLYAVLRSLDGSVPPAPVALAYLAASSVAALVPSPGGFGALDVALVAGLVAVGTPSAVALATVLAYRLLTVWVPLLPGACVLAVLIRRGVI